MDLEYSKYHYRKSFTYPAFQLFFNSEYADVINDKGDCIFNFKKPINVPYNTEVYVKLREFTTPNVNYVVNDSNNMLDIDVDSAGYNNRFLTNGTYTITELVDHLNNDVLNTDAITASFDSNTSKLTFTHATLDFDISDDSTALYILGFVKKTTYSSTATVLEAPNPINLTGNNSIYFTTQMTLDSMHWLTSDHARNCNILAKIPVTSDVNSIIYYYDQTGFSNRVLDKSINFLHVKLYDQDFNALVPTLDWQCVLEFEFFDKYVDHTKSQLKHTNFRK